MSWQTTVVAVLELLAILGTALAIRSLRRSYGQQVAQADHVEDLSRRLGEVEAMLEAANRLFLPPLPGGDRVGAVGRSVTPSDSSSERGGAQTDAPERAGDPGVPAKADIPPASEAAEVRPRPVPASLGHARRQAPEPHPARPSRGARSPRRRVDRSGPAPIPSTPLIAVPSMAAAGADSLAREANSALARRFGPIWELADSGQTPGAIARETGQPIGQVELILGLRRPSDGGATADAVPHD